MQQWSWAVSYDDNLTFEFEDDLESFRNVRVNDVTRLLIFDRDDPTKQYVIVIRPDMRPIFFRRREEQLNLTTGESTKRTVAIVFGWQRTVHGQNVKSLTWLMHDGSVVVTDCDIDDL